MPKKRDINLFFADILEAIGSVKEYTYGMGYEEFIQDKRTRDAVVRKLEFESRRKEKLERVKKGLMNELLTGRKRVKMYV